MKKTTSLGSWKPIGPYLESLPYNPKYIERMQLHCILHTSRKNVLFGWDQFAANPFVQVPSHKNELRFPSHSIVPNASK